MRRGELQDVIGMQIVFWPGDEEKIEDWLRAWLDGRPDAGPPARRQAWRGVAGWASAEGPHEHPSFLDLERIGLQTSEMQLPVIADGPRGAVLVRLPVRMLGLRDEAISMIVWSSAVTCVGADDDLAEEDREQILKSAALVDFSVELNLVAHDVPAADATWWYEYALAVKVDEALAKVEALMTDWELALASNPSAADLSSDLRRLASWRRCIPLITGCLGRYQDPFTAPQADFVRPPMDTPEAIQQLLLLSDRARRRATALEQRIQGSTGLLSQITAGLQLEQTRADAVRQQRFELGVAFVASFAVLPGVIAGALQAADVKIALGTLGLILLGVGLLTMMVLLALLRRGPRRGRSANRAP
jgi:hypothetical protein